jgi:hypothetical protein
MRGKDSVADLGEQEKAPRPTACRRGVYKPQGGNAPKLKETSYEPRVNESNWIAIRKCNKIHADWWGTVQFHGNMVEFDY